MLTLFSNTLHIKIFCCWNTVLILRKKKKGRKFPSNKGEKIKTFEILWKTERSANNYKQ